MPLKCAIRHYIALWEADEQLDSPDLFEQK